MKITLKWDGEAGDGKRAFVVAEENDGFRDLRIEVDTDDCDSKHAKKMMQEVIDRCNAANAKPTAILGFATKAEIQEMLNAMETRLIKLIDTTATNANRIHALAVWSKTIANAMNRLVKEARPPKPISGAEASGSQQKQDNERII